MLERDFTYLAVPYSHSDPAVREGRFRMANKAAAYLLKAGHIVYSPISHCHPIALADDLPKGWEFWRNLDEFYLKHSRQLVVLMLEGWMDSEGVQEEVEIAKGRGIPVMYLRERHVTACQGTCTHFELMWDKPL